MDIHDLSQDLQDAIASGIKNCTDKWGKSYLISVNDILEDYGEFALSDQLLYARGNMQTWKGEEAQKVKAVLNKHIKRLDDAKLARLQERARKRQEKIDNGLG